MDQYELYYTTYNQERDRLLVYILKTIIKHYYSTLKEDEINKKKKSTSLNESLKKAVENKNDSLDEIKKKAHKFNLKARIIQRKNKQSQEKRFKQILEEKKKINNKELELENRLHAIYSTQKEKIKENQMLYSLKKELYNEKLQQYKQQIDEDHNAMYEEMIERFSRAEEYIQTTRNQQKDKFRSLSQKYLSYKQKAESIISEKEHSTFQDAADNMVRREKLYSNFLVKKEENRIQIVRKNKMEKIKYKRSKRRQESIQKSMEKAKFEKIDKKKSVSPKQKKSNSPKILKQPSLPPPIIIEESYTSSQKLDFIKLPILTADISAQSVLGDSSPYRATVYIEKQSAIFRNNLKNKEEKEQNYQKLVRLRLSLKKEQEQLDQELNTFFLSQPQLTN